MFFLQTVFAALSADQSENSTVTNLVVLFYRQRTKSIKIIFTCQNDQAFFCMGSQGPCFNLIINWWFLLLISILARTSHLDMYMIVEREEMSKMR